MELLTAGATAALETAKAAAVEGGKRVAEVAEKAAEAVEKTREASSGGTIIEPDLNTLKFQSYEALKAKNEQPPLFPHIPEEDGLPPEQFPEFPSDNVPLEDKIPILPDGPTLPHLPDIPICKADEGAKVSEKVGLTEEQKAKIRELTGWSDEIIDHIESWEQFEIYNKAGLHEAEINGRKCLVKDIDMDYVDPKTGLTNRERMERGMSPIDSKTGEKIELHHMGQDPDGPFAELCENSEHGDGNHKLLHTESEGSWRNDPERAREYQREKARHWKSRTTEG